MCVRDLIQSLKSRKRVALALGKIGPEAKEAVPALIQALNNQNSDVRCAAVVALSKINPEAKSIDLEAKEAVPVLVQSTKKKKNHIDEKSQAQVEGPDDISQLIQQLGAIDRSVRDQVRKQIVSVGSLAIPALKIALKHDNQTIRGYARSALVEIKRKSSAVAVKDSSGSVIEKNQSPQKSLDDSISKLIQLLGHDKKSVRKQSSDKLVSIGTPAVLALQALLHNNNQTIRDNAKNTLRQITRRLANQSLDDINTTVGLGGLPGNKIKKDQILQDNGQDLISKLIQRLGHDEKSVRRSSGEQLVVMGTRVVPALQAELNSDNQAIRNNAANVLRKIEEEFSAEPVQSRDGNLSHKLKTFKERYGGIKTTTTSQEQQEMTNKCSEPKVNEISTYLSMLTSKNKSIQNKGIKHLISIGPSAISALNDALKDANQLLRENVRIILQQIDDTRAQVFELLHQLEDETISIQKQARRRLISMGSEAIPALQIARTSTNQLVKENATSVIITISGQSKEEFQSKEIDRLSKEIDRLIRALGSYKKSVCEESRDKLVSIGLPVLPALKAVLRSENQTAREYARNILQQINENKINEKKKNRKKLDVLDHPLTVRGGRWESRK